ncbi:MAG: TIGR03617 family F420-dependent LLM class oxidoreductase, partial [Gammaproteobacteria bacterium]|nr:TIGR03617 family F420-dependent LLM class oxidoreductase [Gammaproteobacteria bacterium]
AVALARNPMNMANIGHDLNAFSRGRFVLGLGSQIKPHITRRFGMPWHGAAGQMREFIEAMHAIWDCWYEGKPLAYHGKFYSHSLMTPEFSPTNTQYGRPKVLMAAVGPLMTKTAASVADGIIVHPFCTELHFRTVMLPKLKALLEDNDRCLADFEIRYPVLVASGESEEELEKEKFAIKYRLGFYASTPAYKTVLDTHGWGDLQSRLHRLTREGKWEQLPHEISDEMLQAFAVVGEPVEVARQLRDRFSGLIDRVTLNPQHGSEVLEQQLNILRGSPAPAR